MLKGLESLKVEQAGLSKVKGCVLQVSAHKQAEMKALQVENTYGFKRGILYS